MDDLSGRVVFEHGGVIVVDKPPSLPTSGRTLDDPDCLQAWVAAYARRHVWAVHQLDADTSGLNVFVTKRSLVPVWQQRLRYPQARKEYLAIGRGTPPPERELRVDAPIGYVDGPAYRGLAVTPGGRAATTRFEFTARAGDFFAARCVLESGRTHQIRVHLRHVGLSLVGERWYTEHADGLHPRHALHAGAIAFNDGLDPEAFLAPSPPDLRALADRLGLSSGLRG